MFKCFKRIWMNQSQSSPLMLNVGPRADSGEAEHIVKTTASARSISAIRRGGELKLCAIAPFSFQGQRFHRSLWASIYSTQGIENEVYESLASCDIDLLTSWPEADRSCPCLEGKLCEFALKLVFIRFQSTTHSVQKLVTDEKWTNGQTNGRRERSRTACVRPV